MSGFGRRMALIGAVAMVLAGIAFDSASAGFFDFLFNGGDNRRAPQSNTFDPFGLNTPPPAAPAPRADAGRGGSSGYCVRSCDGRYFPVQGRGGSTPAQMCQAFCPASPTKVFFGSNIDGAVAANGERYADSDNAFAYRKALKADCTCNGRDPTGLAPVDVSLDTTLKAGDVVATSDGLFAYSGIRLGINQAPEFTPVADYPGLTANVRAKLGEMKVAPVSADVIDPTAAPDTAPAAPAPTNVVPKTPASKQKRADID
ncbi:DUF2865 domain-containing protein [Bradyrhizobium prioriisuperbiae]|uniref:DUF2865 domain-containing protein n=1 Tax=Bradyrhizobium prioriisuperbiae TaxID=2854389 RepID=UPI0028E645E6|nr:DUF2865 domain-containing protein [Bradyrhizobium prioritasuperba]